MAVPELRYICLDVANGYSEHFVDFVRKTREEFPSHTIMVGGVGGWSQGVLFYITAAHYSSIQLQSILYSFC